MINRIRSIQDTKNFFIITNFIIKALDIHIRYIMLLYKIKFITFDIVLFFDRKILY